MYYHQQWSESDTVKLIGLYERAQCLWNPENEYHKDFDHQDLEIEAMVRAMDKPGLNENELKSKIKMIRSIYALELHKIEVRSKFFIKPKNNFSNVKWFPMVDKFLRDVIYFDVIWERAGAYNAWDKTSDQDTCLLESLDCMSVRNQRRPSDICLERMIVKDRRLEVQMKEWSYKLLMMPLDQRKSAVQKINCILKKGFFQQLPVEDKSPIEISIERRKSHDKKFAETINYNGQPY